MGVGLWKPRPSFWKRWWHHANHIFQPPWILCASRIPSRHVQIIIHSSILYMPGFSIHHLECPKSINLDSTHHIRTPINCLLIFSIFPWGTANNHMYFYKSNALNFVAILISSALKKTSLFVWQKGCFLCILLGSCLFGAPWGQPYNFSPSGFSGMC